MTMNHEFRNLILPVLLVLGVATVSSALYQQQVDASDVAVITVPDSTIERDKAKLQALFDAAKAKAESATTSIAEVVVLATTSATSDEPVSVPTPAPVVKKVTTTSAATVTAKQATDAAEAAHALAGSC